MSFQRPEKIKAATYAQEATPSNCEVGETWYQPSTQTLFIFTGGGWTSNTPIPAPNGGPGSDYAFHAGRAGDSTKAIGRFTFPFDSGTSASVGNCAGQTFGGAGCNSSEYGYISCGFQTSDGSGMPLSTIERFTFPFDSGTSSVVGISGDYRRNCASMNSSNHGFVFGGYKDSSNSSAGVDRFVFPFSSGFTSVCGNISVARRYLGGCNSSTNGYITNGYDTTVKNIIERITFPNDAGVVTTVGSLSNNIFGCSSFNSSLHAYMCGGSNGSSIISYIERFAFPFDSGTCQYVGNISPAGYGCGANSTTYGYAISGDNGAVSTSSVQRITFPFDSGSSSMCGSLFVESQQSVGVDGTDFAAMFV